jgi:hypothetical protein
MDRQVSLADWKYPGEEPGILIHKSQTSPLPGVDGCQIGKSEWFADGVPGDITREDVDVPDCCLFGIPSLNTPQLLTGFPDIFTDTPNWQAGKQALIFCVFEGVTSPPPEPPSGWDVIVNEMLPSTSTWVMAITMRLPDPAPSEITIDGGSAFGGKALLTFVMQGSGDIDDYEYVADPSDSDIDAPSLDSPSDEALLVVASWVAPGVAPVADPPGMVDLGSASLSGGGLTLWQEVQVGEGETGPREIDYGSPVALAALSIVIL